ncbi:hypothetical protein MycrhN_2653 [Mycolicibacterium rhodesiae NBB3]|uniref:Mycothiol-dependent maleylpyruvate isomerase metal-binding domain-containing protein n=1 Tax=Mycolicibacterium rhodesiae (strain NBB3) TaxID=710685 RepID=G8RYF5_MYCRN|nr:maleylpyruvate isomerase family mycothiol-dependent enzyme [Mycolicibacterium rhodesiae]AEV73234.1 hypothetical protein MycrhN_2653 [Mycolicibacterium rhodesiae NBB3]
MTTATFGSAAESFAALVREIPPDAWGQPGLGAWDVRSLVGHTSRSLITVRDYLQTTAERVDIATPEEYYVRVTASALGIDAAAVEERGRQAGRELGDDPAAAVDALVSEVMSAVAAADDPVITVIGGLGVRLHTYLPTRTFELAVHGMDIAKATGIPFQLPAEVLTEALDVATRTAVLTGHGASVLLALTGREALPPGFSMV